MNHNQLEYICSRKLGDEINSQGVLEARAQFEVALQISKLRRFFLRAALLVLVIFALGIVRLAAEPSNVDKFWSRARISLTVIHASAASYDLHTTRRGLLLGFRERNPIIRFFNPRTRAGQVKAVGFSLTLDLGVSYLVHRVTKKGSPWRILKWEMPIAMSAGHTIAGIHNHHLVNRHLGRRRR